MKKQVPKYSILLILTIMFAAPGVAAYVFYRHPSWLGSTKVNKGTFINPPIVLNALDDHAKWRIVYWSPGECEKKCLQELDTLARLRLALGRKLYQVDQWLILGEQAQPFSPEVTSLLKEQDFRVVHLSSAELAQVNVLNDKAQIFLANPDNYLILSYQSPVNPDDVYKDLKLLLNTTESKSG